MRCPACGADATRVIDSRPSGDAIRRRRRCASCGERFTTYERVEWPPLLVRKRDGRLEPFDRHKVHAGMARASEGRLSDAELERATAAVEQALRRTGMREVTSEQVGVQVLAQLRALDPVAYVRFASVYKDFQRPEDFEQELRGLRDPVTPPAAAPPSTGPPAPRGDR